MANNNNNGMEPGEARAYRAREADQRSACSQGAMLDEHQDIQPLQQHGVHVQEIDCHDPGDLGCEAPSGTSSSVRTTTSSTWGVADGARHPRTGLIGQPVQPAGQEPGPPLRDRAPADPQLRGDRGNAVTLG